MFKLGQTVIIKKTGGEGKIISINTERGGTYPYQVKYKDEELSKLDWFKTSELELYTKKKEKKIERLENIGIAATNFPDFDYIIDQLINLAEAINETRDTQNKIMDELKI